MTSPTVIVFGPTGAVGSAAARTAERKGAKVILAMRDPEKPIPGLASGTEKNFEKVQADLTVPDTIQAAVKKTGAKRAFIYLMHRTPDHMKSSIEALKSAGIELVVFLSSYTVRGPLEEVEPSEMIPYMHARAEMSLEEVFGRDNFVAVRPGYFASNTIQYKAELNKSEAKVFKTDSTVDCIVPEDIGRVCGTVLAHGIPNKQTKLYLYGPELLTLKQVLETLATVLGRKIEVGDATEEETFQQMVEARGFPEVLVKYMIRRLAMGGGPDQVIGYPVAKEELSNVEKFSGEKATTFREWAEQNKGLFA